MGSSNMLLLILLLGICEITHGNYKIAKSVMNMANSGTTFKLKKQTFKRYWDTDYNGTHWEHVIPPNDGKNASLLECAYSCQNTRMCCSFFYRDPSLCILSHKPMRSDEMTTVSGSSYYVIKVNSVLSF